MLIRSPTMTRTFGVLVLLLLSAELRSLSAQQDQEQYATLYGTVVDGSNGQPVAGAWIGSADRKRFAFTDESGRFRLSGLPAGQVEIIVEQLGYDAWSAVLSLQAGVVRPRRIELEADPVILPKVQVYADRLRARRNALTTNVRAFDGMQITAGPAVDAFEFVQGRALMTIRCPTSAFATHCILRRGRVVAPQIFVDDVHYGPGLEVLRLFDTSEVWFIEVLGSGLQVRLYTKAFAERLALGKERLFPVIY